MLKLIGDLYRIKKAYLILLFLIAVVYSFVIIIQRFLFFLLLPCEFISFFIRRRLGLSGRYITVFDERYPFLYLLKFIFYEQIRIKTWAIVFDCVYKKERARAKIKGIVYATITNSIRNLFWLATLGVGPAVFLETYIWGKILLEKAENPDYKASDSIRHYINLIYELYT